MHAVVGVKEGFKINNKQKSNSYNNNNNNREEFVANGKKQAERKIKRTVDVKQKKKGKTKKEKQILKTEGKRVVKCIVGWNSVRRHANGKKGLRLGDDTQFTQLPTHRDTRLS